MSKAIIAMAKSLLAVSLISTSLLAHAAQAETFVRAPLMPTMRELFMSPYAPAEAVTCEQRYESVCTRPCKTWAGAQPDFQYSYDICVAKCPQPVRGTCR